MVWRKAYSLGLGCVSLIGVTLFAFQNCAPEQYFKAQKIENTDSSSNNGGGGTPTPLQPANNRYFITAGELKTTAAGTAAGMAISGRMMMVRDSYTGSTESFVHALGLLPSVPATVHVHDSICNVAAGGGHYKLDYGIAAVLADNEIWPAVAASDVNGAGSGYARTNKHYARPEAQSMVIHDAAGARMACGLMHSTWSNITMGGKFNPLAAGVNALPNARGYATISRLGADNLTIVRASLNGLAPGVTYASHVHNLPCATTEGGGHYKQNADVVEVVASAAAEIWLPFTTTTAVGGTGGGHADVRVVVPHVARADAASIVVHDPTVPATRLLCVDLTLPVNFIGTEAGLNRYPQIAGSAKMERLASGETKVTVANMAGLTPNTKYMMHVHDRPCHVSAGGGHYKHDYSIAAAIETNEVWLTLNTDAVGGGSAVTLSKNILRPEAYSVVLHEPDAPTNTRLACADLYQ